MTNPLLEQHNFPPLERITPGDFEPAVAQAIEAAREKAGEIAQGAGAPTFQNTVVPLESLFADIYRVTRVLSLFNGNASTPEITDVYKTVLGKVSAFSKIVFQDQALAERFKAVYNVRDSLPLDDDDRMLLKNLHRAFESEGAFLSADGQARVKDIDQELIGLCNTFDNNVKRAAVQQAVLITDPAQLAGLPDSIVSGLRKAAQTHFDLLSKDETTLAAEGKKPSQLPATTAAALQSAATQGDCWLFVPERLQVDSMLTVAEDPSFRETIFKALNRMGTEPPFDNNPVIQKIIELRDERAKLIDSVKYPNYAAYALAKTMAGSVKAAQDLLTEVEENLLPKFEEDMHMLESFSNAHGGPAKLQPWDVPYWETQWRNDNAQFDAGKFSEYLELNNVLDGFFRHAEKLFSLEFRKNDSYARIDPDVQSFDVYDSKTKAFVGVLVADFYARGDTKKGGAWMSQIQTKLKAAGIDRPNVVSINANYVKPSPGKPTLLSVDQLETLFHEGGHALNGLLGTKSKYPALHGTGISSDWVEIHSMIQENWALQPECLKTFARHYQTDAPVPDEMIDALGRSRSAFGARESLKIVANSLRDFAFHTIDPKNYKGVKAVEDSVAFDSLYALHMRPYAATRFTHLFDSPQSQYAAGYYGYLAAEVRKFDGFSLFEERGDIYDAEASAALKEMYAQGCAREPNGAYAKFRGRPATIDAFLRDKGVEPVKKPEPGLDNAPRPSI